MYPVLDTTCQTKHLTCFQGHYPSSSLSFHSQFLGKTIRSQNSLFARKRFIVNRRWWRQFYVSNSTSAIVKLTITALYGKVDSQTSLQAKWWWHVPSKFLLHKRLSSIKCCLPSKVVLYQCSSSVQRSVSIEGRLQVNVFLHQRSKAIIHTSIKLQSPSHTSRQHQPPPYTLLSGTITHQQAQFDIVSTLATPMNHPVIQVYGIVLLQISFFFL